VDKKYKNITACDISFFGLKECGKLGMGRNLINTFNVWAVFVRRNLQVRKRCRNFDIMVYLTNSAWVESVS